MSTEPIAQSGKGLRDALQLVELAGHYQRAARARQLGLHQMELTALEHLVVLDGLTPGELAHRLGLTSGGVTALVGRLVAAGLVCREPHPSDRRMRVLSATAEGEAHLRDTIDPVLEAAEDALAELPEADLETVSRVLELVASAKEEAAEATPGPEPERATDGYTRALLM